jgi:hypothetical protein
LTVSDEGERAAGLENDAIDCMGTLVVEFDYTEEDLLKLVQAALAV